MNWRRAGGRLLAAMSAGALLTACTPVESEPQAQSPAAVSPPAAQTTPTTPGPTAPPATPESRSGARAPALGLSSSATNRPRSAGTPPAAPPSRTPDAALRLPVAADLGPNYFELLAASADVRPSEGPTGGISAEVVGFGFSERAKLRDERIIRDGPLAAVARITEHPSPASAVRFAAAANAAASRVPPGFNRVASAPGLTAALTGSPPTSHKLASDLVGARTLGTGWLTVLDGTRIATAIETWTVVRFRTVLTVVLVWGSQANDGWSKELLARLAETEAEPRATRAA